MTEETRQELFQDAEPAADGGKFRFVVGLMGLIVLLLLGWMAISLNELEEDVESLRQDDSKEIIALQAELAALKQETEQDFHDVKETLSGVWHRHKPGELEIMGILASLDAGEREALLAALESPAGSSRSSSGKAEVRGASSSPLASPSRIPEPAEDSGEDPVPVPEPVEVPGEPREPVPEPAGDQESGGEGGTARLREYRIQRGDSLSGIAQKHAVSAEALARANGITDPDRIRVGQVLSIPDE